VNGAGKLRDPKTWLAAAPCLVVLAVLAWELASGIDFLVDDSYITFSYSKNLARGVGLVYGHDVRVEGYSNFLWTVLVAVPMTVLRKADPMLLARATEVPFAIALIVATYCFCRRRAGRVFSFFAALLLAVDIDVILAFQSGLESLPYAALLVSGFYLYDHGSENERARRLSLYVFTAVALTRIDGFIPLGFIIVFDAISTWFEGRFQILPFLKWALPGVVIWSVWFASRWAFYGIPLPTTYYAKALIPELLPRRGQEYVVDELSASGLYGVLPAFLWLLWQRQRSAAAIGLFSLGQIVYAARVGGDWMPCGRFLLPALPLLVVLGAWGFQSLADTTRGRSRVALAATWLTGIVAFVAVARRVEPHVTEVPLERGKLALAADQTQHVGKLKRGATLLARVVPPGGRLVTDYGGVLAYYTEANPIEMWGLCNAMIATRGNTERVTPIYGRTCPSCYPELHPEFFHVGQPLVREVEAFRSHADVVRNVWQTDTIGRYIDFNRDFVSGRIVDLRRGKAAWFLELRKPGSKFAPRSPAPGLRIEYPFVPGGT
jgi:arabinofuranosyltransferase